jgi:hypothetical protein
MSMAELQALVVAINLCPKTQTPGGWATNSPKIAIHQLQISYAPACCGNATAV